MTPLVWAVALILIGAALIVLEMFVPSGGVIGILAAAAFIGAIVMGFQTDNTTGGIILCVSLVTACGMVMAMIKLWPHTPIGKKAMPPDIHVSDAITVNLQHLQGAQGLSKSTLMPNGEVDIDGTRYDAVSQGTLIPEGSIVRVTSVKGNRILVELLESDTAGTSKQPTTLDVEDPDYSMFEDNIEDRFQQDES